MEKSKKLFNKNSEKLASVNNSSSVNKEQNVFFRLLSIGPPACRILFCAFIVFTMLILIFIDKDLNTYCIPNSLTVPNIILIFFSLLLFAVAVCAIYFFERKNSTAKKGLREKQFYAVIGMVFIAVYGLQLFISAHIYFKTGWDVVLITKTAEDIAFGGADGVVKWYYSTYPNNMLITYTLVFLYKIGNLVLPSHPYAAILAFVSFVVCASVFLATICIYRITNSRKFTVFGMIIGILMIALSPWIVIPYTDAIAMIFPVAAIFFYLFIKNKYVRYALITFVCILGYYYKPTIIIIMIALVIIKFFTFVERLFRKKISLKSCACMLLCIVLAAGCAVGMNKAVCSQNKTELVENMQMTMTHYFMMGLNTATEGVYSENDVQYSMSMPDVASRQSANIEVAKSRLKEMGPKGYLKLLLAKNMATYNDGTFGWGGEGNFYFWVPEDDSSITNALRSFYYTNEQGTNYLVFATAEQILWLFLLICICFCVLPFKTKRGADNLIALTLLGVSMFLLLFECRARYLFLFTPLFLILAMTGLRKAYLLFTRRKEKEKKLRECA